MSVDSVLITGCSAGGIGTGIALAFQKQGLHVFATAPSLSLLSHFSAFDNVTTLCLDVTSSASISAAVDAVRGTGDGKLKYLVNNAGLGLVMPILDTDVEKARKLFDVNFLGTLAITKAFVPLLIEGGEGGCVLNMGSGAGLVNVPWSGK
jgi:1-acylglycerone phosphate reductase